MTEQSPQNEQLPSDALGDPPGESDPVDPEPVSEPTNEPDHAQIQPESSADDQTPQSIYLPQLMSDEFGMSSSVARDTIAFGTVEIGGEPYTGDPLDVPYDLVKGKEIVVKGRYRAVRFTYNG